jgi:hypothetical protein
MQADGFAGQHQMMVMPGDSSGEGGCDGALRGKADIGVQRVGGGWPGTAQARTRQAIFAVAGGGGIGFGLGRRAGEQAPVHITLRPVAGGKMLAFDAEIDIEHLLKIEIRQQRVPVGRRDGRHRDACGFQDRCLHQVEGDRDRGVEDAFLQLEIGADVIVPGIDGDLLLAAGHQNDGAGDDQRPERPELLFLERVDLVIGLDGGQHEEGICIGLMQQRGTGDGEIADQPAADDIAEIDDPVGNQAAMRVVAADDVVAGDVMVDGL